MQIKRRYLFFPDKEGTEKTGYKPDGKLRFRIRYGHGSIVAFNVGYRVKLDMWITEAQRCKSGSTHGEKKISATEINNEIQRLENLATEVFKMFEVNNNLPTESEFREAFNEANDKYLGKPAAGKSPKTFFEIFDEFTNTMGVQNQWTKATYTKFAAIRKHLYTFNSKLSFDTLSDNDMLKYVAYLHSLDFRNTTIDKNVDFVKWFIKWAYGQNYYQGNVHLTFRPKFKGTDGNQKEVIHLTWEELNHLYEFDFSKARKEVKPNEFQPLDSENAKALERIRDVFCFTCFTGLRYSDVAKLSKADVKSTYLSIVTQKTSDGIRVELNDFSKEILEKYKNVQFKNDKVLPVISNQKMNEQLKDMGEIAGINEPQRIVYFKGNQRVEEVHPKYSLLTTHCGRRTFIVNALYLNIPAEVIMRWTGHSDYKAMKPYVKIVDELKVQEMNKFNRK